MSQQISETSPTSGEVSFQINGIPADRLVYFVGPAIVLGTSELVILLLALLGVVRLEFTLLWAPPALVFWIIWVASTKRQGRGFVGISAHGLRVESHEITKVFGWEDIIDVRIEPEPSLFGFALSSESSAQTVAVLLRYQTRLGWSQVATRGFGLPSGTNVDRFRIENADKFVSIAHSHMGLGLGSEGALNTTRDELHERG